jgi:hypothetical protein
VKRTKYDNEQRKQKKKMEEKKRTHGLYVVLELTKLQIALEGTVVVFGDISPGLVLEP